jgi:hypothetical protein
MLEVRGRGTYDVVALESERVSVGASAQADIVIDSDPTVSRLHLLLERIGSTWFVRDMSSRNGTYVNGDRVTGERALRPGDDLLVGRTRLVFRDTAPVFDPSTDVVERPPELTRRERDVLDELCRPLVSGDAFTPPATVRDIADAMVVGPAAVKQHLSRLYEKFGIPPSGDQSRRVLLANEAVRRGAVVLSKLRAAPATD